MLLNDQWMTEEIKQKIKKKKKTLGYKWKWKHNHPKHIGFSKSSSKRKVYSDKSYLRKEEKSQT